MNLKPPLMRHWSRSVNMIELYAAPYMESTVLLGTHLCFFEDWGEYCKSGDWLLRADVSTGFGSSVAS